MRKSLTKFFCAIFMTTVFSCEISAAENNVIIFETQAQPVNQKEPWKKLDSRTLANLGVYIGGNRFLTTYRTVDYARSITGQKVGDHRKIAFKIVASDRDLNLAILEPAQISESIKWIKHFKEVSFTKELSPGIEVEISRLGQSLRLKRINGRIRDVVNSVAGYSDYQLPLYKFDGSLVNGKSFSEIVFKNERVVGLASYINSGALFVLPAPIITDFILRSRSGSYSKIPSVYFSARVSINPFERKSLLVPEHVSDGVLVDSVDEISPFNGLVIPGDLIVAANGQRINYKGEYQHPDWGEVSISYLLKRLRLGDELTFDLYRSGQAMKVKAVMNKAWDPLKTRVPPYFTDDSQIYLIVGGLVFHNLSRQYMEQWGARWKQVAPVGLVKEAVVERDSVFGKGQDKVIVLSQVLPMDFNRGYHGVENYIVSKVNNISVKNLAELEKVLRDNPIVRAGERFMTFEFKYGGLKLILKYQDLEASRSAMIKQFGLPHNTRVF